MRFRPACDDLRKCLPERRDGRSPAPWASSRLAWVDDRHLVIHAIVKIALRRTLLYLIVAGVTPRS